MSKRSRLLCALLLTTLLAAACGRSDDDVETGSEDPPPAEPTPAEPTDGSDGAGLDEGAFGDLGVICQDGDPAPVTDEAPGLTGTEVRIATFTDVGFSGSPGLNAEFIDTAEAFADWCNANGGINGRQIVVDHRDAALAEFQQRILESCDEDFFMVGGGAVFDDSGQPDRLACGLPDISGFMVTSAATESDLHLEPVPNPAYFLNVSDLEYLADEHPEAIKKVWDFEGSLPTLKLVSDRIEEAATELGYEVVHRSEYNPGGEANWKPFVQAAADAGAEAVFWTGEPENLVAMLEAADEIGFNPEFVRADANHYTPTLIELGGDVVDPVITRMGFYPFELADENPATTHYLELMDEFNPDGKVALLGAQGLSGWLLFVTAANECDAAGTFTRDCIFDAAQIDDWTGGGLHSPQNVPDRISGDCTAVLAPGPGLDFVVPPNFEPNEGPWVCDPDAVVPLTGDYGAGATCPSGVADPKPSTCAS